MVKYFSENLSDKNSIIKQKILDLCMNSGDFSIADFARELNCSVPTTTKIVGELIDDGWLEDLGKKARPAGGDQAYSVSIRRQGSLWEWIWKETTPTS